MTIQYVLSRGISPMDEIAYGYPSCSTWACDCSVLTVLDLGPCEWETRPESLHIRLRVIPGYVHVSDVDICYVSDVDIYDVFSDVDIC